MVQEEHRRFQELEPYAREPRHAHLPHSIGYHYFPSEAMAGYTYLEGDLCICTDALVLFGISVEDDGNNAVVHIHEGRNALAPVLMAVQALANLGAWRMLTRGVELDNGLFVAFDAHVTSVTIFWRPRYEREAG